MKIVGIANIEGKEETIIKGDSALLVNRKPFFIPECAQKISGHICAVARISRLGKNIEEKFASRYYDGLTLGINFIDEDMLRRAITGGNSWTMATTFDNSLSVGTFQDVGVEEIIVELTASIGEEGIKVSKAQSAKEIELEIDILAQQKKIEHAIHEISQFITIRQGDMLFIDLALKPMLLQEEELIVGRREDKEILHCKIK